MALTVVVRSGDSEPAPTITFDAPRVVIGRGEGCDVRLPDPSVSHRHASLRQRGSDYLIVDEGSSNGTWVGPVRLSPQAPRVVRSGDLVRVGRVFLELRIEQAVATQHPSLATQEIALALVSGALAAEGRGAAPRVSVREGPDAGHELRLTEFDVPYLVGRAPNAALILTDDDASRGHVELRRRGNRLLVRDLGSKNGSELGGQRLPPSEDVPWPPGTEVRIGQSRLVYEDPVSEALADLERLADERMRDGETVEAPRAASEPEATPEPAPAPPPKPPRRAVRPAATTGWSTTDFLVALISLVVLALSILGLSWLFSSN